MANLTNSLVQEYEVIPANQDVGNRFDQNNFYPMDGMDEMNSQEYSELFGIKSKKKGGEGFKAGIGRLFGNAKTANTQEGLSRLEQRLQRRGERAGYRAKRKQARRDARQARQLAALPPAEQQELTGIAQATPVVGVPVAKARQGVATPPEEQVAVKTAQVAQKIVQKADDLDVAVVKEEIQKAKSTQEADVVLDEILDPNNNKGKAGWKGMTTGVKVAIIGGGVAVLGLITYFIVKAQKNKATS